MLIDSFNNKSGSKIFKKIIEENNRSSIHCGIEYNYIIISMAVLNVLEELPEFESSNRNSMLPKKDAGIYHVGYLKGLHVFVDLILESNMILFKYDLSTEREIKLNIILNQIPLKVS